MHENNWIGNPKQSSDIYAASETKQSENKHLVNKIIFVL